MAGQIPSHNDPEYRNFVVGLRGYSYVGTRLASYTRGGIKRLQTTIINRLGGHSLNCKAKCSDQYTDTNKWCSACKSWKTELLKERNNSTVNWKNTKSWEWPSNDDAIINVYLPNNWGNVQKTNINDISTAVNIWSNCKEFKVNKKVISDLRRMRNTHVHERGSTLKCSTVDKTEIFDTLRDLLRDPDISNSQTIAQDLPDILLDLQRIEDGDDDLVEKYELDEERMVFEKDFKSYLSEQEKDRKCIHRKQNIIISFAILSFAIVVGVNFPFQISDIFLKSLDQRQELMKYDSCLSENYTFPFHQDMPLFDYISHHTPLTGRQWLFEELKSSLFNQSSMWKGVHLVAPMGYGKSAICKHLLCASGNSSASTLQRHIVAYHICRFDVPSTKYPDVFIRRLVGFLANKHEVFRSAISRIGSLAIFYDIQRCREDPIACFDQGITTPLSNINNKVDVPWVIVIDALDECSTNGGLANVILDILRKRAAHVPKWLKFLITSRDVQGIKDFSKLQIINLSNNDTKNKADMKEFIKNSFETSWLSGIFAESATQKLIAAVDKTDPSFLYISQSVLFYRNDKKIGRLPPTLVEIYQSNFERMFGFDRNYFRLARNVLELVCASTRPLLKELLLNILEFHSQTENFNATLYENTFSTLSEFLLQADNVIVLNHMATFDWLVRKETNTDFHISLENGHSKIARYMLFDNGQNFKSTPNFDIIDLAIHTARSNRTIKNRFKRIAPEFSKSQNMSISYLNSIIATTDEMGDEISLLLNLYDHVDTLNNGNVTPAFYAAFKGHVKTLNVLAEAGADLDFAVRGANLIRANDHFQKLKLIKSQYFWGYNLLHIAVQQSNVNVVNYLLEKRRKLINESNAIGMLPIDIACENGYLSIVEILIKASSNVSSCFNYASYGGHVDIVKFFISLNFSYTCVSSDHAAAEYNSVFISNMKETDTIDHEPVSEWPVPFVVYIRPKDSNRIISKFSPLNVAIQSEHTKIVSLLIKEFPRTLDCVDSWGRTPLLQSIAERKIESYKKILQIRKPNDVCQHVAPHMLSDKLKYSQFYSNAACYQGAKLSHLLAVYGTEEMINYTMAQNIHIECGTDDALGLVPFHIAIQNSNIYFTDMCSKRMNYVQVRNIKTTEGATVYHHAARYGQYDILRNISKLTYHLIPDLIDMYGVSIIQYAVYENVWSESSSETAKNIVSWLHEKHYHDLTHHDASGRNIIHYAVATGHWGVIEYVISVLKEDFWLLVAKTDFKGYNAVDFGLQYLKPKPLMECYMCMRRDLWTRITRMLKTKIGDVSDIMTHHELSVFLIIKYAFQNRFSISFFRNHFNQILSKSDVLTIALLEYLQESHFTDFTDQIVMSIRNGIHPVSFLTIARYKPEWLHQCNKHLNESPLHLLMKNADENIFYPLQLLKSIREIPKNYGLYFNLTVQEQGGQIFRWMFGYAGQFDNRYLSCATVEGLNLMHVALRHGNLLAAHYFLLAGISIVNNRLNAPIFFSVAMFSKLRFRAQDTLYEIQVQKDIKTTLTETEYLDYIIYLCYIRERKKLKYIDICNEYKHELSLVHFAAVNGLVRFLGSLHKRFGNDVLACRNKDGITPLYLAKIFGQIKTVELLEKVVSLKKPKRKVESHVLFHVLHTIKVENASDPWHCLLKYDIRWWSVTSIIRYYSCNLRAIKQISDRSLKVRIELLLRKPDCKDCQWKIMKNEPEVISDILTNSLNFLTYTPKVTDTKETSNSLTEKLIEDIKAMIGIKKKTKANEIMLKRLVRLKNWLIAHQKLQLMNTESTQRLQSFLQYVIFQILVDNRGELIAHYALYIYNGLLGIDNMQSSSPSHNFLNTRLYEIKPFLRESNMGTFSLNLSKYYYLSALRKTVGFQSLQRTLQPSSIVQALSSVKVAEAYTGSKNPLQDLSDEPRVADFVIKETNKTP